MPNVKHPCLICKGEGRVPVEYGGDPTKQLCPKCLGNGYVAGIFVDKKDCSRCDTRGVINIRPTWEKCVFCDGKGYKKHWVSK
jgi:DnaJ-class molecular chaperone